MSKFTLNLTKFWSWHFVSFPTPKNLIKASIEAVEIVKRAKRLSRISPYSFDDCVYLAHLTKNDSEIEKAFELAAKLNKPPCTFIIDKRYKGLIAGGE
jgi:hypothetical protein